MGTMKPYPTVHNTERITMAEAKRYGKAALVDDITASARGLSRRQVAETVDAALDAISR
jgi:hypothetical protein